MNDRRRASALTRDDLIRGLRQLVAILDTTGSPHGLRIVGGAALSLRYFERGTTVDIDAHFIGDAAVLQEVAEQVAQINGWQDDWINNAADGFIPEFGSVRIDWQPIYLDESIVIEVAPADALLAMKLNANRPGRDDDDIAALMTICGIDSVEAAEELFESFYSGEVLADRAVRMVEFVLRRGLPPHPTPPPPPDLHP